MVVAPGIVSHDNNKTGGRGARIRVCARRDTCVGQTGACVYLKININAYKASLRYGHESSLRFGHESSLRYP